MGVPVAYGDSRSYFRTAAGSDTQQSTLTYSNQAGAWQNAAYNNQMASPYRSDAAYITRQALQEIRQNLLASMVDVTPVAAPSPQTVIRDRGFGGGEGRPRSRRYAQRA